MTEEKPGLSDFIDRIMTYMTCAGWEKPDDFTGIRGKPLNGFSFDGAEPFTPEAIALREGIYQEERNDNPHYGFFADVRPRDLSARFDIALVVTNNEDATGIGLERFKQVDLEAVRGKVQAISPFIVEQTSALISGGGRVVAHRNYIGFWRPGVWRQVALGTNVPPGADVEDFTQRGAQMAMAVQFNRRYQWMVNLGYENSPTVAFPSDPSGVQEIFALRDLPNGTSRRAALKHWVEGHWRKLRDDPNVEIKVREHLRGGTKFVWNGLACRISIAEYDKERDKRLLEERNEERKLGIDRRSIPMPGAGATGSRGTK